MGYIPCYHSNMSGIFVVVAIPHIFPNSKYIPDTILNFCQFPKEKDALIPKLIIEFLISTIPEKEQRAKDGYNLGNAPIRQ